MIQRFKAVETAHNDSQWHLARHYEIIPETEASVATYTEREHATRLELRERQLKAKLMAAPPGGSQRSS